MRNLEVEPIKRDQPKILIFPNPHENPDIEATVDKLRKAFRVRTTADTRGRWGHKEFDYKDTLLATKPDILIIFDPLKDSEAARFMSKVPRRSDGKPKPAIIAVPTVLPQEMPLVRVSYFARQPLKHLHLPRKLTPGYAGTIMDDVDAIIVPSEEVGEAWNKFYPADYKVISPNQDVSESIRQMIDYCNEVLWKHSEV